MSRIFITGSSDGLGRMAASLLIKQGHEVVLHARNEQRAKDVLKSLGTHTASVVVGDLSDLDETRQLANEVNKLGPFDSIIHNAGVYNATHQLITNVNTLAPYILTCLITKPARLIYLSSGDHRHGTPNLDNLAKSGRISYADSKLHDVMLAFAVARKYPEIYSNSVDPGWVPTKMGGSNAPDDLDEGYETQSWLAVSSDKEALTSGHHFFHKKIARHRPEADDVKLQERFLQVCEQLTGVRLE